MTHRLLALALLAALAGCDSKAPEASGPAAPAASQALTATTAAELDTLYAEYWEESLKLNPINATFIGDKRYNDQLPNFFSADYRKQTGEFNRRWLQRLQGLDVSKVEGQARLSHEILVESLQEQIAGEAFPDWQQPINQFFSVPNYIVMLGSGSSAQPFKTVKDYDDWLARAGKVPALFEQAIANMREGVQAGVVQPRLLMQKVLPQLDGVVSDDPQKTPFWGPISNLPADFSDADKKRLTEAYTAMINQQLVPAFRGLRTYLADEYIPVARETHGLGALPNGAEWYAHLAKSTTTTSLTPAEIHQIGLDEVARLRTELEQLKTEVGFEGDLKAFFKYMSTDPKFTFSSEEAILKDYRDLEAKVNQKVPELFSLMPKAAFEIRPVEAFRAASEAAGSYMSPSEDGTRPGIFYLNTYDLPARKSWARDSLYLHEAIPGHHFQLALQQELEGVPAFRRFGGQTAYIEGWGLYAESLGKELGVYADPYQRFGQLSAEIWRAIRLVVDTGLHSKGWTREQVLEYMHDNSGLSETDAIAEAERYMAIPGQALAYKIGQLKITELRNKAQQELGDKFDIREFHAQVLGDGSLPLAVLETKIDRWIATKKAAG